MEAGSNTLQLLSGVAGLIAALGGAFAAIAAWCSASHARESVGLAEMLDRRRLVRERRSLANEVGSQAAFLDYLNY